MAHLNVHADVKAKTLTVEMHVNGTVQVDTYEFETEEETIAASVKAMQILSAEVLEKA